MKPTWLVCGWKEGEVSCNNASETIDSITDKLDDVLVEGDIPVEVKRTIVDVQDLVRIEEGFWETLAGFSMIEKLKEKRHQLIGENHFK